MILSQRTAQERWGSHRQADQSQELTKSVPTMVPWCWKNVQCQPADCQIDCQMTASLQVKHIGVRYPGLPDTVTHLYVISYTNVCIIH